MEIVALRNTTVVEEKLVLPSHWASALINGDLSIFALQEDEDERVQYHHFTQGLPAPVSVEENGFTAWPGMDLPDALAGDYSTYTFWHYNARFTDDEQLTLNGFTVQRYENVIAKGDCKYTTLSKTPITNFADLARELEILRLAGTLTQN